MSDKSINDVAFNFGELWMLAASLAMALGTIFNLDSLVLKVIQLQLRAGIWF